VEQPHRPCRATQPNPTYELIVTQFTKINLKIANLPSHSHDYFFWQQQGQEQEESK
jgi:hypothetical protein